MLGGAICEDGSAMPADELDLIRRAIAGDTAAISLLLGRHGVEIARSLSIHPKWQSVVSVDDVMQVTYLEAFLEIADFVPLPLSAGRGAAGSHGFAAWLRRIADNNLRDAIKELERLKRPPPDRRIGVIDAGSYVDLVHMLSADSVAGPSRVAAANEAVAFIEDALGRLPTDYQRVIQLYELEGRSIAHTAEAMGRSEGSIKMLLSRARDRLRVALGSDSRFFSDSA